MSEKETNKQLSRRSFIKITAVAGGVLAGGKLLLDIVREQPVTVQESRLLMGTVINLAVVAESRAAGEEAISATFSELERQVAIFTRHEEGSPLDILNRTGRLASPPQELVQVLSQAAAVSVLTNGAFDVTVKPLVDLYQQAQPALPTMDELKTTLELVDCTRISISPEEITLDRPGMGVTLDGIAKGYIVDAGTGVLKRLGFENVYVEAGGDLMASGTKEEGLPWKIGIQSPRESQSGILARINVRDQAVATSGDYILFYSSDRSKHHILDPRSGVSAPELASATIVSENAMHADALATAVMVLGVDAGLALIEEQPACEAYLVNKNGHEYQTSGINLI